MKSTHFTCKKTLIAIIVLLISFSFSTLKPQIYQYYKKAKCLLLKEHQNDQLFEELSKENPSAQVIKTLLEDCADADAEKQTTGYDLKHFRDVTYIIKPILLAKEAEILNLLLDHGASVDEVDHNRETPLMKAARNQNTNAIELLLKRGASINKQNSRGYTPLILSFMEDGKKSNFEGKTAASTLLIKHGADNTNIEIPFMWAALNGTSQQLKLLVSHGAPVNFKNLQGRTALHLAALSVERNIFERDVPEKLKVLLEAGADPNIVDYDGKTPLDNVYLMASLDRKYPSQSILDMFKKYGAKRKKFSGESDEQKHQEQKTTISDYDILGVPRGSSKGMIQKAYRKLALKWHPDKNTANPKLAQSKMAEINAAYERLTKDI